MTANIIYASSLKGFCSIRVCWQFLYDVSSKLVCLHESHKSHGSVDLNHVEVKGQHFELTDGDNDSTQASDVWALAASAMELILGSPIFNGGGENAQSDSMPIPTLPYPNTDKLNMLLHRCLDSNSECRPSAAEIKNKAQEGLEQCPVQERTPRIHSSLQTHETLNRIDSQWPEKMIANVARLLLLLLLMVHFSLPSFGQVRLDENKELITSKLMKAVLILRQDDLKSWNAAQDEFEKWLSNFTLMNGLQDQKNDCSLVEGQVKFFGVNRMVTELKKKGNVQNSGRELLDGSDARFNYSLYEKGIKKGCTATYTVSGRSGKQVFLIIPFSMNQSYTSELIKNDGTHLASAGRDDNGISYYFVSTQNGPAAGETLTLKISNKDQENNASFVIVNHNYRNNK